MTDRQQPPCDTCAHVRPVHDSDQLECIHPHLTVPSAVNPKKLIGVDASAVRYKNQCLGKPQCGPAGSWWEARA